MMRVRTLGGVLLVIVGLALGVCPFMAHAQAPGSSQEKGCGDSAWVHVYRPSRLTVFAPCLTVTGTIVDATHHTRRDGVRKEADGDTHGWLRLDPPFDTLLNAGNKSNEGGNLVFEITCHFPVTQRDAIAACRKYKNLLHIPADGTHVRITGTYVQDDNHEKWMEIHPVSSIVVIP